MSHPLSYPPTRREDRVEMLHGIPVADPYRWMEDDHGPETAAWVAAQNTLTESYLAAVPARAGFKQRLTGLWDYEKFGVPFQKGGRIFFTRNDGLQNQSVLYWLETPDGEPRLLLDPNTLSADGTVALTGMSVSEDGQYLAYSLSGAGSDWQEWRVRRVASGDDLADRVLWSKFSGAAWTKDGLGFFYSRYDEPDSDEAYKSANYYQKLYYHHLGTPQAEDRLIYQRPDQKEWGFGGQVSDDGRYLVIEVWHGTHPENAIFYLDLADPGAEVVELLPNFDATYTFIGSDGPRLFFHTNLDAPRSRVVAINLSRPTREEWIELVPESADTLEYAHLAGERIFAIYLHHASHQVQVFDLAGRPHGAVKLPGMGTVMGFDGGRSDRDTFYLFTSFTTPGEVYRYDLASGTSQLFRRPALCYDPADYVTEQVFYASKDGTRIPMFLTYKKGLARTGQNQIGRASCRERV